MEYRTLGRTGLQVSALALGTVELGLDYGLAAQGARNRPSERDAVNLVHRAIDSGINFLDTARAYGDSERVLGIALAGRRDKVILATKVDPRPPAGVEWSDADMRRFMRDSLETSLLLLQTDHVDIWMIHSIDESLLARREVISEVFENAQRRGQVHWSGASFYGVALPELALGYDLIDVMQIAYSVLDQRVSERVLPLAAKMDVGIVARSVLLKGVLTERADYLPAHLETLRMKSRQFRQLIAELAGEVTPAQGAIAFALAQDQIDTVLIGANSVTEFEEDLASLQFSLTDSVREKLAAMAVDDEELLNPSTWGIP